jgi:hypothetical protein
MTSASGRTIVFGDVHGCLEELQELLSSLQVTERDALVSVGDLIGKGPDSRGVLEWAMGARNLRGVLGNHELRFLEAWRAGRVPAEKEYDAATVAGLGTLFDAGMDYLSTWPLWLDLGEALVVHGGLRPGVPLEGHDAATLTTLRTLPDGAPWFERYDAPKLAVFGHWVHRAPVVRLNAVGLDTGCVYGGMLTALVLPERRLVAVQARRAYVPRKVWAQR